LEQQFLDASQRLVMAADIRRRRRVVRLWRYLAAAIAVAILAIVVAAAAVTLQLRSSAAGAKADGQRLASFAVAEPDLRRALLLAVAGTQLDGGTAQSIRTVLLGSPDLVAAAGTDVTTVALSPDGRTVAAATTSGTIWLYGGDSLNPTGRLDLAGDAPVNGVAFTPDGRRLVSWGGPRTGTSQAPTSIVVWDLASKQPSGPPFGQPWPGVGGGLLADGVTLLLAQHGNDPDRAPTAVAWSIDARTPSTAYELPTSGIDGMQLSADGRYVVFGAADGTRVVDLTAGTTRLVAGAAKPLALSPDGHTLLTAEGVNIGVWNLVTGHRIGQAVRHSGDVLGAAWSPDGARFASVGADGLVIAWDTKTLQPVKALTGHGGSVRVVRFAADGGMLYTVGADGSLFAWDLTGARGVGARVGGNTATLIALACTLAGRDLTPREWQTYLPHRSYRHVCPA
jgi:WD40 repeat protein